MTFADAGATTARVLGGYLQALDEYYTATVTTHFADGLINICTETILDNPPIFEPDPDAIEQSRPLEHSYELKLERAEYKSPLLLVLSGCLSALTVAVILSGGKISFGPNGLMADLPPLGVGLRRLKGAATTTQIILRPAAAPAVSVATMPARRHGPHGGKSRINIASRALRVMRC